MANCKDFYFPRDERDSFILVVVGLRCTWSPTHLITLVSSCGITWSSLLPASIESLAAPLQYVVHWARASWTSPTHWSPGLSTGHFALIKPKDRAGFNALVHQLHGHLAVLTTAVTTPKDEALHFPDVLSIRTLHHEVHGLLYPSSCGSAVATQCCSPPHGCPYGLVTLYIVSS